METIRPDKRVLAIAANLLYKYGGNGLKVQTVEYDLFNLLVSANDECNTRFGVVVSSKGLRSTEEYSHYIEHLHHVTYTRESPDNVPILLMLVDSEREDAEIGFQLGWSSAFTPIIYHPAYIHPIEGEWFRKIYAIAKAMNSTITILSREYLSVQKTISLTGIRNNGFRFEGVILYAKPIYPKIPKLSAKTQQNFEEDNINKYLYNPQFENDEIDELIIRYTNKKFANIAEVNQLEDKMLLTSSDVQNLQLYGKAIGGYEKMRMQYLLQPTIENPDQQRFMQYVSLINIHKITLCIRGGYDRDLLQTLKTQIFTTEKDISDWVEYSRFINEKLESTIDLYDFIV